MNKRGLISLVMVVISIVMFLLMRGPDANVYAGIIIFSLLSIIGIIFAILSKHWVPMTIGLILNGGVLIFTFLLLLATGISES